ncbi:Modification methylase MthTI [Candidatus Tiddalikarchaeum anstoanum]|nr:Modification methylase MthTI [Candidatus Tiddalikarchaeum anstoanum]
MNKNPMENEEYRPKVVDLFCGAGGLSTGFRMAGFDVLLGIDNIPIFCETFEKNDHQAICGDIRTISVEQIKQAIDNKKIEVVVGGPPCQGFSMAGRRNTKDPRNSLFMEFVRIVAGLKPKFFVMENVPGILTMKTEKGELVKDIIFNVYKMIGYNVEVKKLNAADYGVPQKRKRVVFIGTNTKKSITFPEPTHSQKDNSNQKKWVPVSSVIKSKDKVESNFFHTPKMIEGFVRRKKINEQKGKGFGAQYLKMDEPSYTISARYWKDGSDALVKYSENEIRMLTPEEAAAIQTFPSDYKFAGSKRDIYTQIGNAVPCLLGKAVAEEIKKSLLK